jgi:thiamine-phosphate pyrophosphorylase
MEHEKALPGPLLLITDSTLFGDERAYIEAIEKALAGGVRAVQMREKAMSARAALVLARKLRRLTTRCGSLLLINERVDIAMLSGADGVHLPSSAFSAVDARALLGEGALIGVSTHSMDEALAAKRAGADYITFGPVYHTPSKARYGEPPGLGALEEVCSRLDIPVFGLGGISAERAQEVMKAGAAGIALIRGILTAPDPEAAARSIMQEIAAAT